MANKVMSAAEAIATFVRDGQRVMIGGFPHLIPSALGHEIIRQGRRDLTLIKESPEVLGDQLIGTGCVSRVAFGFIGIPSLGTSPSFRRVVEAGTPPLVVEEYTHFTFYTAVRAAASGLPFLPVRSALGTDYMRINPHLKEIACPFTGEPLCAVPALRADVGILHAQCADEQGNVQVWGLSGLHRDMAFSCDRLIVSVEEVVPTADLRRDPDRVVIPGFRVSAVVPVPWGAHPSYAQGYYDRDEAYYIQYAESARTADGFARFMAEWVYGVKDRSQYLERLGVSRLLQLQAATTPGLAVNYGY